MFDAEDADALLIAMSERGLSSTDWCALKDVDKHALAVVVSVFGACPDPGEIAVYCTQFGWEAREEVEPRGLLATDPNSERFSLQYAIVDTRDGSIQTPLRANAESAMQVVQVLNAATGACS